MAGHSHSANIAYRKALVDGKKGKLFSKLAKLIMVAARTGGGDPAMNLPLKYAIEKARAANMTRDAIERAVKKGTGENAGETYDSLMYEGYGPGGVAILAEILTDKRSRTAPELRKLFEINGGTMAEPGAVAWQFEQKGSVALPMTAIEEGALMELVLEQGAHDLRQDGEQWIVLSDVKSFEGVRGAIERAGLTVDSAEVTFVPKMTIPVEGRSAEALRGLIEALDDHDDVQRVHMNGDA
jgi:YebC/PmpR family DNA-binding regulatory protein